jgi:hypothetical protein
MRKTRSNFCSKVHPIMSMESAAVIGGVAVVNKLVSNPVTSAQQSTLTKLGKSGGQPGIKKTLDIFTEEDQSILSSITHGARFFLIIQF